MKTNNKSFIPSSLPHDRKVQFMDIMKHRYMLLILCGIMIFIGFLPVIFAYGVTVYISNASVFSKIVESYTTDASQQAFIYFWTVNVSYAIMIPLLMLGFVVLTGGLRIYRLLSWGEGVFFFHDFFRGIKANFKTGLLLGLFLGIFLFIIKFIGGALSLYLNGNLGIGVELFLKGVLFIFVLPIAICLLILTTYFDDGFFKSIKNGFYLYANKPFFFIPCSLILLVIYLFPFISNYYLILLSIVIVMLFIFPIYILLCNQLALSIIDKTVETEGAKLKGLYDPEIYKETDEDL